MLQYVLDRGTVVLLWNNGVLKSSMTGWIWSMVHGYGLACHVCGEVNMMPWSLAMSSYQIRKIAGCACAGNAGYVFPRRRIQRKPLVSDPGMPHGTCVTHVPWGMSGSLTCGDAENVPGIPGACAPAILRIWQEVHCLLYKLIVMLPLYSYHIFERDLCEKYKWDQNTMIFLNDLLVIEKLLAPISKSIAATSLKIR